MGTPDLELAPTAKNGEGYEQAFYFSQANHHGLMLGINACVKKAFSIGKPKPDLSPIRMNGPISRISNLTQAIDQT